MTDFIYNTYREVIGTIQKEGSQTIVQVMYKGNVGVVSQYDSNTELTTDWTSGGRTSPGDNTREILYEHVAQL